MPLISYESVAKACELLVASSKNPSVRAIIAHLGGGSPNAVIRYQQQWKQGQPTQESSAAVKQSLTERVCVLETKLRDALIRVEELELKVKKYVYDVASGLARPVPPIIENEEDLKKFVGKLAKETNIGWLELTSDYRDILVGYNLETIRARFRNTRHDGQKKLAKSINATS